MTKLEELKAAWRAAEDAAYDAYDAYVAVAVAAYAAYEAELKKQKGKTK